MKEKIDTKNPELRETYELCFNASCASISVGETTHAQQFLKLAEGKKEEERKKKKEERRKKRKKKGEVTSALSFNISAIILEASSYRSIL